MEENLDLIKCIHYFHINRCLSSYQLTYSKNKSIINRSINLRRSIDINNDLFIYVNYDLNKQKYPSNISLMNIKEITFVFNNKPMDKSEYTLFNKKFIIKQNSKIIISKDRFIEYD